MCDVHPTYQTPQLLSLIPPLKWDLDWRLGIWSLMSPIYSLYHHLDIYGLVACHQDKATYIIFLGS